jgi:hypothetical protein
VDGTEEPLPDGSETDDPGTHLSHALIITDRATLRRR